MTARRLSTYSAKIREKYKAKWDDFVKKTDFWKSNGVEGLWGLERPQSRIPMHAIEDRFGHEYAFAWEPFKDSEPPKLLLMRTLQKEMWASALKRGTWFLDPQND